MEKEKEKIGIEEGDFITPKKAITISTISLIIWFVTGLSFKVLSVLSVKLPYESYALVVSLSLSILFSIYIVRKLVRNSDLLMRIIIGVLNTILIYTSANGAQATYSFLSPVESTTVQKSSMIPFLDSRPWIPDKFLRNENRVLADNYAKLLSEEEELVKQNELLQVRINDLRKPVTVGQEGSKRDNLLLRDSISMLANSLAACQRQNDELSRQLQKFQNRPNDQKSSSLRDSLLFLGRQNAECMRNNAQLKRQLETLQGSIQQIKTRKGMQDKKKPNNIK